MDLIKPFKELGKDDAAIAGGKGASLGEMTQAGIPVPPGFVILADAFEQFIIETELIAEIDAILEKVDHHEMHTVEHASETIQGLILHAQMPENLRTGIEESFKELDAEFVAVRSSATAEDGAEAAWAGQLDTFLNTTQDTLLEKVQECWASLFTPRAIFYRFEKGMDAQKISVAVVVQKMVNSDAAGIAFSVHPVTEDYNQMIVEAGFGLGEAVVSGQVTPDSYVVTKEPLNIIEESISEQAQGLYRKEGGGNEWKDLPHEKGSSRVLSTEQIFALATVLMRIENHYGFPVDTEWAMEDGELYIVQSRPITTLTPKEEDSIEGNADNGVVRIIKGEKIVLSKIFSREKPLFYFSMWNDSDRLGYKRFLDHDVTHNVFLIPGKGEKGTVWYSTEELNEVMHHVTNKITHGSNTLEEILSTLHKEWSYIEPYLLDEKKIEGSEDLSFYYMHLVIWWSAMTSAFEVPNLPDIDSAVQEEILTFRSKSEKFTEKMSKLMVEFWERTFPEYKELSFFVTPSEAVQYMEHPNDELLSVWRSRKDGCAMIDGDVYPLSHLDSELMQRRIILESVEANEVSDLKGSTAYKGKVQGEVHKIHSFAEMKNFKAGEVLVTEMTNPDYVQIMKIAAAVVTDEGGMTCHAAIASRELKIPCIVGTKFATQILQDGDLVEVDADNGVVRILKKKTIEE